MVRTPLLAQKCLTFADTVVVKDATLHLENKGGAKKAQSS